MSRHTAANALTLISAAALLVACSASTSSDDSATGSRINDPGLGHVHGLGTDPADNALFIASHHGVFRVEDKQAERVADRWQDTMAFTVVGPGNFLASGHPDLREDLPPHLGLIETTDAARTWSAVSRQGEADFHAIEVASDRLYAYDAVSGSVLVTTDRKTWRTVAKTQVADLAVDPTNPSHLLVTTPDGTLLHTTSPRRRSPRLQRALAGFGLPR